MPPIDDTDTITPEDQALMRGDVVPEGEAPQEPETPAEKPEAEAPPAEGAKPEEKEPEVQKLVPHGAFEEERARRKTAQQEAQTARETAARLQGQLDALNAGKRPEGLTEQQKADWDKDPIAAGKALQAKLDAQEEQAKQSHIVNSILSTGQSYCQEFAKSEPQFFSGTGADGQPQEGAYQFGRRSVAEKLAAQGVPPHEIEMRVNLQEIKLINTALETGINPAKLIWFASLAEGFKPAVAAAPAPVADPARAANGQFQKQTEAERIAIAAKAQAGGKSLGSVPAGSAPGEEMLEDLAGMSDDEFKNSKYMKMMQGR